MNGPPIASAPDSATIADSRGAAPQNSPRKTAFCGQAKRRFGDAGHWGTLAERYLGRYVLPTWSQLATAPELRTWIERMDLPERAFLRMGAYKNLQDAIDLNPTWPLRALIGLALELRDERR